MKVIGFGFANTTGLAFKIGNGNNYLCNGKKKCQFKAKFKLI